MQYFCKTFKHITIKKNKNYCKGKWNQVYFIVHLKSWYFQKPSSLFSEFLSASVYIFVTELFQLNFY